VRSFLHRAPALGGLLAVVACVGMHAAGAATIVQPAGVPTVTAGTPMTIVATGFAPGRPVYVEQCDGDPARTQNWSPTLHCDLGSSPPPIVADASGEVAFRANVAGRALRPFAGESPQSLFNCTAPNVRPPGNALPSFTNCQVRVSSNNADVTADQVFFSFVLAAPAAPAAPGSSAARSSSTTTLAARAKSPAHAARPSRTTPAAASTAVAEVQAGTKPARGVGLSAFSDRGLSVGYALVVLGLAVCAWPNRARRARRVHAPRTGGAPATSG